MKKSFLEHILPRKNGHIFLFILNNETTIGKILIRKNLIEREQSEVMAGEIVDEIMEKVNNITLKNYIETNEVCWLVDRIRQAIIQMFQVLNNFLVSKFILFNSCIYFKVLLR